jgi:hypothetical protein
LALVAHRNTIQFHIPWCNFFISDSLNFHCGALFSSSIVEVNMEFLHKTSIQTINA